MGKEWERDRRFEGAPADFVDRLWEAMKGMKPHPTNPSARLIPLEMFGEKVRCLVAEAEVDDGGVTLRVREEELDNERDWLGQVGAGLATAGLVALGAALGAGDAGDFITDPEKIAAQIWKAADASLAPR